MLFFKNTPSKSAIISKTAFFTSFISYLVLVASEVLRPGFASRYFSIHLFLLAALVCGFWWESRLTGFKDRSVIQYICAIGFGGVFFLLFWRLGQGFAEYRILMSLLALAAPLAFLRVIRSA